MQKFQKELTESPVPAKLLTVIKQLIPLKVEDDPYLLFEEWKYK